MAERVVLHIGTMKTGTTYLQAMLRSNRQALVAAGHVYAGMPGRTAPAVSRVLAKPNTPSEHHAWHQVVSQARDLPGDAAVISTEFLSFARPHQIRALLAPFGSMPIEIVLTIRDQVGAIPSQWQTFCRNFGDATWPEFLTQIDPARAGDPTSRAWRAYYRGQESDRIIADWTTAPGVARAAVVTLPHVSARSQALWDDFAAAGRLHGVVATEPNRRVNPSVGHASAQMLQDLGWHWKEAGLVLSQVRTAMRPFIAAALVPRRASEPRPQLDRAGWEFARRRNEIACHAIGEAQDRGAVELHGSLTDLLAPPAPEDLPDRARDVGRAELRSAAGALWAEGERARGVVPGRRPLTYRRTLRAIAEALPQTSTWDEALARTVVPAV